MQYHISRDGKTYGPYALPDLQRMLAQGQLLPDDLAWSEGMSSWTPLKQVLSAAAPAAPAPAPQPQAYTPPQAQPQPRPAQPGFTPPQQPYAPPQQPYAQPGAYRPPTGQPYAAAPAGGGLVPPGMHWALVFVLALVTCGIFGLVWMFLQAGFVKKIDPASKATPLFCGYLAVVLLAGVFVRGSVAALTILPLIHLAAMVVFWMGAFSMRKSLVTYYNSVENIGLRLSGVMTFFFSVLYFQYHLARIANWKKTGRFE
ncbi:MAG: DUF4339 domain-containing protein [Acidobacteria bacterium]|nr:DUF4339 domain-containing protein [Acidobacteriota bacterium]